MPRVVWENMFRLFLDELKKIIIIIVTIAAKHGIISLIADLNSNGIHIHTLLCLCRA